MIDALIVGQGVGIEALAALGAAEWQNWLMLWLVQGVTQGFAMLIAQRFGGNDIKGLRKSIAKINSLYLNYIESFIY